MCRKMETLSTEYRRDHVDIAIDDFIGFSLSTQTSCRTAAFGCGFNRSLQHMR